MKTIAKLLIVLLALGVLSGCTPAEPAQVAATTLPMYQFTAMLCAGTPITVTRLVTGEVSCLHDYSLTVGQMKAIEGAELVIISGAGLEEFMDEALLSAETVVDASAGIELLEGSHGHDHEHEDDAHEEAPEDGHSHELDPHIWLSPECAMVQARNICAGLSAKYPEYAAVFEANLANLLAQLEKLDACGKELLRDLRCRQIITFHDGFAYLAQAYDIEIVEAIEEESGAEASAQELIHLIEEVEHHGIPAIFVETNSSGSAASIIAADTGAELYTLDMAMSGDDYFAAMYHNIDTLKEALG